MSKRNLHARDFFARKTVKGFIAWALTFAGGVTVGLEIRDFILKHTAVVPPIVVGFALLAVVFIVFDKDVFT